MRERKKVHILNGKARKKQMQTPIFSNYNTIHFFFIPHKIDCLATLFRQFSQLVYSIQRRREKSPEKPAEKLHWFITVFKLKKKIFNTMHQFRDAWNDSIETSYRLERERERKLQFWCSTIQLNKKVNAENWLIDWVGRHFYVTPKRDTYQLQTNEIFTPRW